MVMQVNRVGGPDPLVPGTGTRSTAAPAGTDTASVYGQDTFVPSSVSSPAAAPWLEQKRSEMLQGKILSPADAARYYRLSQGQGADPVSFDPPAPTPPETQPQPPAVPDPVPTPSTPAPSTPPANPPAIPGLTPEEASWAVSLAQRVQQGYKPTAEEVARYQALSQKAAAAQAGSTPAAAPNSPSADDARWAAELEAKVQQGYAPTPEDIARYQRIKGLDQTAPATPPATSATNLPATVPSGPPSPQELQWAAELEAKVQQGYNPTLSEVQTYQAIRQRGSTPVSQAPAIPSAPAFKTYTPFLQNENPSVPSTPPSPPTQAPAIPLTDQEIAWAQGLEEQIRLGYQPSAQELQAYESMKARYTATTGGGRDPNELPLYTDQELQWAQTIEQAVAQGYQPVPEEARAYQDIKRRFLLEQQRRASKSQNVAVSQLEVQWAAQLKRRIEGGYQPTPQEAEALKDIARRLLALQQAAGGGNTPTTTTASVPPSPLEQQYTQVNWQEWSKPVVLPGQPVAPMAPIVTQPPVLSAPPTLQPINAEGKPLPIQAPTPQEMQWATQLEQRVQQGYQPTPQEIQQHDTIYQRYQASRTSAGGGFFSRLKQGFQNFLQRLTNRQPAPASQR